MATIDDRDLKAIYYKGKEGATSVVYITNERDFQEELLQTLPDEAEGGVVFMTNDLNLPNKNTGKHTEIYILDTTPWES